MARAHRVDRDQRAIVAIFRRFGFSVQDTSNVKDGFPDLVLGGRGWTWLVEVKTGNAPHTKAQVVWADEWRGSRPLVVRSQAEAIRLAERLLRLSAPPTPD